MAMEMVAYGGPGYGGGYGGFPGGMAAMEAADFPAMASRLPAWNVGLAFKRSVFSTGVPSTRCSIDKLDTFDSHFASMAGQMQRYYLKPQRHRGADMYCSYCTPSTNRTNCTVKYARQCDGGFVYDRSQYYTSMVSDFAMVCEDGAWRREFVSSLFMAGNGVGVFLAGAVADRVGRRISFVVFSFIGILGVFLLPLVRSFLSLGFFMFINGIALVGAGLPCFSLLMEFLSPRYRSAGGMIFQGAFTAGYIVDGILAYYIRSWHSLQWVASLPMLLLLCYVFLLPESPRWLHGNGRHRGAAQVLYSALSRSGANLHTNGNGQEEIEKRLLNDNSARAINNASKATLYDLLSCPILLKQLLTIIYLWFTCSLLYYGLSLNATSLPGDTYTTFILSGLIEYPGLLIAIYSMERYGRRFSMVSLLSFSSVALLLSAMVSSSGAKVLMAVVGKFGVSGAFAVIYNYSAEMLPTQLRNTCMGLASVGARVASLLAPQVALLEYYTADWVPMLMYGIVGLLAAVANKWFLPETLNRPMPESIEDCLRLSTVYQGSRMDALYRGVSQQDSAEGRLPHLDDRLSLVSESEMDEDEERGVA